MFIKNYILAIVDACLQFSVFECVLSGLTDEFPSVLRKYKIPFKAISSCVFFLLGIPLTMQVGTIDIFLVVNLIRINCNHRHITNQMGNGISAIHMLYFLFKIAISKSNHSD